MGRWGDGSGRGGDGEMGRRGDAEKSNPTQNFVHPKQPIKFAIALGTS
ncbi:MAG: hypothetical protein F6K58_17610 [Symploca sp. SIO2E9]|nr:hypothetical protein [Symploca sp. SIO2E9]